MVKICPYGVQPSKHDGKENGSKISETNPLAIQPHTKQKSKQTSARVT